MISGIPRHMSSSPELLPRARGPGGLPRFRALETTFNRGCNCSNYGLSQGQASIVWRHPPVDQNLQPSLSKPAARPTKEEPVLPDSPAQDHLPDPALRGQPFTNPGYGGGEPIVKPGGHLGYGIPGIQVLHQLAEACVAADFPDAARRAYLVALERDPSRTDFRVALIQLASADDDQRPLAERQWKILRQRSPWIVEDPTFSSLAGQLGR